MTQLSRQNRDAKGPVQNKMDDAASSASQSFAPPAFQLKTAEDDAQAQVAQRQEGPGVSNEVTEDVTEHLSLREGFRRQVYLDSRAIAYRRNWSPPEPLRAGQVPGWCNCARLCIGSLAGR